MGGPSLNSEMAFEVRPPNLGPFDRLLKKLIEGSDSPESLS
jgi:hypothetical protein